VTARKIALAAALGVLAVFGSSFIHLERFTFPQSPEQAVALYADRVVRGETDGALGAWTPSMARRQQEWNDAYQRRREIVTRELTTARPSGYRVVGVELWRTCCEPGIAEKPEYAGLARLRVAFEVPSGPREYFFDVRKDPSCCMPGDPFESMQFRYWTLIDVYPTTKLPLQFTWVYDPVKHDSHGIGASLPEP
jgi:hypothetical protein